MLALGLALAASACVREARPQGGAAWVGRLGPETVEGRVRVIGNEPFSRPFVQPDDDEGVIVSGEYKSEIRRLAGAQVRVSGHFVQGELPQPTLEASSYEILSVDGDAPLLGLLERDAEGFYLVHPGGSVSRVTYVSDPLSERLGGLVWVVLDERGGVARYGILREPT